MLERRRSSSRAGLILPPGQGRKVPVAGDKVTIEKGKDVVLDVSPPALAVSRSRAN
jgi:hypothetical protein